MPRPIPPVEPEPWECCGSGCEPCIYDRYWEALDRYERELERWKRAQVERPGDAPAADSATGPEVDKGRVSP